MGQNDESSKTPEDQKLSNRRSSLVFEILKVDFLKIFLPALVTLKSY